MVSYALAALCTAHRVVRSLSRYNEKHVLTNDGNYEKRIIMYHLLNDGEFIV